MRCSRPTTPTLRDDDREVSGVSNDVVSLRRDGAGPLPRLAAERARTAVPDGAPADLAEALQVAQDLGPWVPLPMQGDTLTLWESLASIGAVDLTIARVVEPHLEHSRSCARRAATTDPRRGLATDTRRTGAPPGCGRCTTRRAPSASRPPREDGSWALTGTKSWCSLADRASHALVTAWVDDTRSGLFAIHLVHPAVSPGQTPVPPIGRRSGQHAAWPRCVAPPSPSTACRPPRSASRTGTSRVPAPPGAAWASPRSGTARQWHWRGPCARPVSGASPISWRWSTSAASTRRWPAPAPSSPRPLPSPTTAGSDTGGGRRGVPARRQVVADTAEEVMARVGRALGPVPLTGGEEHARRVADLTAYVRQHHGERDLARQGEQGTGRAVLGRARGMAVVVRSPQRRAAASVRGERFCG